MEPCIIHTFPKGWQSPDPYDEGDDRDGSPPCIVCGVRMCGTLLHGTCKRTKGHQGRHTWLLADVLLEEQRGPSLYDNCLGCGHRYPAKSLSDGYCAQGCHVAFTAGQKQAMEKVRKALTDDHKVRGIVADVMWRITLAPPPPTSKHVDDLPKVEAKTWRNFAAIALERVLDEIKGTT